MRGLYIHIPFCQSKCGYCDFYSIKLTEDAADRYVSELKRRLRCSNEIYDTVYFGGGTPSAIGGDRIADILGCVRTSADAEITVECNPNTASADFMSRIAAAGVNRISIGMQSANQAELVRLTRTHTAARTEQAVGNARRAGINNISLDVMLGIEGQTAETLKNTIAACDSLGAKHVSAYMLKFEPNTPFYKLDRSAFPSDDDTALLYEIACRELEDRGFMQYEISNFAKRGMVSRHNLKYWNCEEYDALGPSAHLFREGKRYYYPRDLEYFINGGEPLFDDDFGGFAEYAMLRLRLSEGLNFDELRRRGLNLPDGFIEKCQPLAQAGFMTVGADGIRLTKKGFLVQNALLCEIL